MNFSADSSGSLRWWRRRPDSLGHWRGCCPLFEPGLRRWDRCSFCAAVDGFDEGAVDGDEFLSEESGFKTDEGELAEDSGNRRGLVFSKPADGAVVGEEMTGQPDGVEVVGGGVLEAAAGTDPGKVSPKVKLEEDGGMVAGATDGGFIPKFKPEGLEIQAVDKGVDGPHRVLATNQIVHRGRKKHCFTAIQSFHECHGRIVWIREFFESHLVLQQPPWLRRGRHALLRIESTPSDQHDEIRASPIQEQWAIVR